MTRRSMLAALLGAAASPALATERNDPPVFESARRQFAQLRPLRAVPPIRLSGVDGRTSELTAHLGNVTLVNFWASWCPACRIELPLLEQLHSAMADRGVRVVAISVDRDTREAPVAFLRKLGIRRLPVFLDPDGVIAYTDRENRRNAPFALYGMPISYVIDRAHRIVGYLPGEADWTSPAGRNLLAYYAA
jgi:thiol-disulfide isomerase/thioredoxin